MTFSWNEYLELAKEMAGQPYSTAGIEARLRTSISRAYYGAYCQARNYLQEKGIVIPRIDSHKFVIDEFNKLGSGLNTVPNRISKDLGRLKTNRLKADYDNVVNGLQSLSCYSILLSTSITTSLATI